jgi:hypothetical protein
MIGALVRRRPFQLDSLGMMEHAARRIRYRDCYRRLPLAPALDDEQRSQVEELKREGTLMLPGYIAPALLDTLQRETQQALEKLAFEMPCLAQARLDPRRHADLLENFLYGTPQEFLARGAAFERREVRSLDQAVRDFEPSILTVYMLERSAAFRQLWLDPWLLGIVTGYLGLVPKLVEAYVRRNFPSRYWTMNHYWHRDLNDRHQLVKMFVFLSDTTVHNGPHEFVRGSHAEYSRLNGKRYYSDAEVDREYPPGSRERLVSEVKAGTIIIEDTRGLHRARMPDTGHRDLGYAVFVPAADGAEPDCYAFPRKGMDRLSAFQKAFIPAAALR